MRLWSAIVIDEVLMTAPLEDGVIALVRYDNGSYGFTRDGKPLQDSYWPHSEFGECATEFSRIVSHRHLARLRSSCSDDPARAVG
jgi:hypothetical protein